MDNLRELLGISRMDRVPNEWIRELCEVKDGLDERINEGVLRLFGYVKMETDRIAKSVYVGECGSGDSVVKSLTSKDRCQQ